MADRLVGWDNNRSLQGLHNVAGANAQSGREAATSEPSQCNDPTPTPGQPSSGAGSAATSAGPYPPACSILSQEAPQGIRFDFNQGARVSLPARQSGRWKIRLRDLDTGNVLFASENQGALVASAKRYFVRFGVEVWDVAEDGTVRSVFAHDYDARGKDVIVQFPIGTLGDTIAWFSYVPRFAALHGCRLTCAMSGLISPMFAAAYPDIRFVTHEEMVAEDLPARAYATYSLGLFFDDVDYVHQPTDFRHVGLHRTAGYILGVDVAEQRPIMKLPDESRPVAEPYICIAAQSTTQCKYWNNPRGWLELIKFCKEAGYRVICIDQKAVHGSGILWNQIPHGAEDETGDRPLVERARWLRHAAAFVGVSSGLSWLAWAAGCPVVLVSGFSHPNNEFDTPYRVINWHACNSCWNDSKVRFQHDDFAWCPRHKGTDRQFECSRLITPEHVISTVKRIPGFNHDLVERHS